MSKGVHQLLGLAKYILLKLKTNENQVQFPTVITQKCGGACWLSIAENVSL